MKTLRIIKTTICFSLCAILLLAGCQSSPSAGGTPSGAADLNIAVVVFGTFGDNGFNDLSKTGLERAISQLGIRGEAFESGGYDITRIEPLLLDLCEEGNYDAIFVMGAACREAAENASSQFPNQKFILFDAVASYADKNLPNIASVTFRQNEASFLGGVLAGYVTTSDMKYSNSGKTVGIVLLRDNAVINDFLVGFIDGCRYIDRDIRILSAYNNSASDVAKAKELSINMASQGADVIFGVASLATLGVVDACKERNIYAIGVDNDVALQIMPSDPAAARLVLTSVLKNTDVAVFRAIKAMQNDVGELKWGAVESVGFEEGCVGLAKNDIFDTLPQDIKDLLLKVEIDIISGALVVSSAFGMTTEEVAALRDTVAR